MKSIGRWKYHIFILIMLLAVILFESYKPKKINWFPSYTGKDKIPYGTYILKHTLPTVFPNQTIKETYFPPFNVFYQDTVPIAANYIFINNNIDFSKQDKNELLHFVANGGNVFIAAHSSNLFDTLHINREYFYEYANDSILYNFFDDEIKRENPYWHKKQNFTHYYCQCDTSVITPLGYFVSLNENDTMVNFFKMKIGKGNIYINLSPELFTNYQLTDTNNYDYPYRALTQMPIRSVIWDENFKTGKQFISTPLRFVLMNKPLKYAYYLLLALVALFILFDIKRKQRAIPVISPKTNDIMAFVDVVGRLYFNTESLEALADKKLYFWLNYIRSNYNIPFNADNKNDFIAKIAKKTGHSKKLITQILAFRNKTVISEKDLMQLHLLLKQFYNKK